MAEEIKKDKLAVEKAPAKKTVTKAAAPKVEGEKKPAAKKAPVAKEAASEQAPAKKAVESTKAPAKTTKKAEVATEVAAKAVVEKAPAKKVSAKKSAPAGSMTIKLVRSLVGRIKNQKECAAALGLKKVGDVTVQPDNAATKGKIVKISHLVEVTKY